MVVLFYHDFRSAAQDFVNKHALLIGNGFLAQDIALQLCSDEAESITLSYRTKPEDFKWPNAVKEVPLVVKIDNETGYFKDGASKEVVVNIFCTGYLRYFLFLNDNLRLKLKNSIYIPGLHKSIFWLNQPHLLYLGIQRLTISFNIGNVQAWYACDMVLGKTSLHSTKADIQHDTTLCQAKVKVILNVSDYANFHREYYVLTLIVATAYPRLYIGRFIKIYLECVQ